MKIYEKVLDLLKLRVFEEIPEGKGYVLFSGQFCGTSYNDFRIGISDVPWYNEALWGDGYGKLLKNGGLTYEKCYRKFCDEWVDSFISDIDVQLFFSPGLKRYGNVFDYLRGLKAKKESANRLFDEYINDYGELAGICPLIFNVNGEIGDESIGIKLDETSNNPAGMLENVSWIEDACIICDEEENYIENMAKEFFDRLNKELDILKVSKLFSDVNIVCRRTIYRNDDGTYRVKFENWGLWRSNNKEWVEKLGQIEYEQGFFSNTIENLIINGSYEEISTMIDLLKGEGGIEF